MKLGELRRKILPDYAVIPAVIWVLFQFSSYYVSRLINRSIHGPIENYHDVSLAVDNALPLVSETVIIYVLTYVFWVVSFIWISQENKEFCCRAFSAELLGKLICMAIFITFPTYALRPEVTGSSFSDWLLRLIYTADTPDNLFPSMHCSVSWFAMRYCLKARVVQKWYKIFSVIMTLSIFFSVLLTKQHVVLDIIGGVFIAEVCIQIGNRTKLYKTYEKLDIGLKKQVH